MREGDTNRGEALPWERLAGQPSEGVGICLSGGGLRAAYFALGALQALQRTRQLLFGSRCGEYLSVVSGGSYIASTFMLNASALARDQSLPSTPAPLDPDAPETDHVLSHGRYLLEDGKLKLVARLAVPGLFNVIALIVLFLWTGTMLADFAWGADTLPSRPVAPMGNWAWAQWPLAAVAILAGRLTLRGTFKDGGVGRWLLPLGGGVVFALTASSLVRRMRAVPPLASGRWWWQLGPWLPVALVLPLVVLALSVALGQRHIKERALWLASWVVGKAGIAIPRVIGFVFLSWAASAMYPQLVRGTGKDVATRDANKVGALFVGVLVAGWLFGYVSDRVSLHRPYRDLLGRCFGVVRSASGLSPASALLSSCTPPVRGTERSYPRLLVCATANVRWRPGKGRRSSFAPFVYSHDRCGVPGAAGASFATVKLELGRVPHSLLGGEEPEVSLLDAVATTGAAFSPSMGRRTIPAARPVIALLNIRLGKWLPNPLSNRIRHTIDTKIRPGKLLRGVSISPGYDELLPDILGPLPADARRLYVSDGGHYDNLGLLTLLRARCAEIWCIDSGYDPKGRAAALELVKTIAKEELDITIELDLTPFQVNGGKMREAHSAGTIDYPGGSTGTITVVKLGMTAKTPGDLVDYRRTDRRFPSHPTWLQIYPRARADAYRKLGDDNATAALTAASRDLSALKPQPSPAPGCFSP